MKCLTLLAVVVSNVLADADPSPDAQYYGAAAYPHHQYLGGLPYNHQPHFVASSEDDSPANTVKLVAVGVPEVSSSPIISAGYGYGLPHGYAGLQGYPGYGNLGHLGYGYGYAPHPGYGGLGYPYGIASTGTN